MLGQEIEKQQFDSTQEVHEFSDEYEKQKRELLTMQERRNKKTGGIRRIAQVAAAFILVLGVSVTAYAVTSNKRVMRVNIKDNKEGNTVSVEIKRNKNSERRCLDITPGYLPLGYEEWMYGKYSYEGVWAADGLTIGDYNDMEKETFPYEKYEERQIGDAKAMILDSGKDTEYRWKVLMFYEQEGNVIVIFGSKEITKAELIKVCENLTYEEISEKEYLKKVNSVSEITEE